MVGTDDQVRREVRERYAQFAVQGESCCGPGDCGPVNSVDASRLGYTAEDTAAVPAGADMGLGCGNPVALAALQPGETVVDLGSGGGIDCFIAARQVGADGHVIGVDMTPEMLTKARAIAAENGYANVEFRLGEIEHLPVADDSVDVVISNCVIDLSPDQPRVYREAFRVLRPGGRIAVSDVVASAPLPPEVANDPDLFAGCIGGAAPADDLRTWLAAAGFADISVTEHEDSRQFIKDWAPGTELETYIVSASIEATKP